MKYIIYMSAAYKLMTDEELLDILAVSRGNNVKKNLTGMLLYGDGAFVQVLEGETEALDATYDVIKADPRHKNIIEIISGEIDNRNFPDWSMGFKAVDKKMAENFEGFIDFKSKSHFINNETHPAITVLKTFAGANNMI